MNHYNGKSKKIKSRRARQESRGYGEESMGVTGILILLLVNYGKKLPRTFCQLPWILSSGSLMKMGPKKADLTS